MPPRNYHWQWWTMSIQITLCIRNTLRSWRDLPSTIAWGPGYNPLSQSLVTINGLNLTQKNKVNQSMNRMIPQSTISRWTFGPGTTLVKTRMHLKKKAMSRRKNAMSFYSLINILAYLGSRLSCSLAGSMVEIYRFFYTPINSLAIHLLIHQLYTH